MKILGIFLFMTCIKSRSGSCVVAGYPYPATIHDLACRYRWFGVGVHPDPAFGERRAPRTKGTLNLERRSS